MKKELKNQQFLILTDLKTSKIKHLNDTARSYCGFDVLSNGSCFYQSCLHPEDYPAYKDHLSKIRGEQQKQIKLRVKNKEGNWSEFHFSDRLYQPSNTNDPAVLTVACPVSETEQRIELGESADYNTLKNEYENLISSLDEGFCIVELIYDEEGEPHDYLYLKTNPAFQQHVDFQDVTGKTVRELVDQPNQEWLQRFAKVAETGKPLRFKEHNSNLGETWLDLYAFKIGDKESRRIGILFRNITSEKKQEEELQNKLKRHHKDLQESKNLLQNVFDNTNLAIAVLRAVYHKDGSTKDFVFVRTNKVLQELYLKEDIIGRPYSETSRHGVEMGIFDAYKSVMSTGAAFDQEFFFDKDGYSNWFRVTARSQDDLLITTLEDITERKQKAKELEETIRFKRELVRATPEIIMIVNLNHFNVRYINKDIVKDAGLTRSYVEGKPLQDLFPFIHPRDREKVMEFHKTLLKSSADDIIDMEIRLKLQGINWEWFNVRGKIFKRKDENWVDEYVLLVRNITDQKNTQKALLKAEKLSIQGEIARTFAHELRNPLASIGMVGEVLSHKMKNCEEGELNNYFEILKRSTQTLNDLVTDLLNSSNYTPPVLNIEDLSKIMDSTLLKAADRIYLSGIKVTKKYEGKYPILADKEKLEIALLNLLVNASEAIIPGQGSIEVEIEKSNSDFILTITDNGHGMDQEQIDHLFEAFFTKKDTGMGIGMNSVKNILEEHDAQIKVSSELNKGSSFSIFFHNAEMI